MSDRREALGLFDNLNPFERKLFKSFRLRRNKEDPDVKSGSRPERRLRTNHITAVRCSNTT